MFITIILQEEWISPHHQAQEALRLSFFDTNNEQTNGINNCNIVNYMMKYFV